MKIAINTYLGFTKFSISSTAASGIKNAITSVTADAPKRPAIVEIGKSFKGFIKALNPKMFKNHIIIFNPKIYRLIY